MSKASTRRSTWLFALYGGSCAVILLLPTLIWGNDAAAFFGSIPLAFLIAMVLLVIAWVNRRQTPAIAAMMGVFLVLVFSLFKVCDYLRTTTRWLTGSQTLKTQVLNQPPSRDGSLKHVEWDGWGFPGAGNTVVYLVNDPSDQLEEATKKGSGKFAGIPCEAVRVRRLERFWYTVLFYTDTEWNHCA